MLCASSGRITATRDGDRVGRWPTQPGRPGCLDRLLVADECGDRLLLLMSRDVLKQFTGIYCNVTYNNYMDNTTGATKMSITAKQLVLLDVTETIARISASPKNATAKLKDVQFGMLKMARIMNAITAEEFATADDYIRTAANWRGVRNFQYVEKWLEEYETAQKKFNEVWL